MSFETDYRPRLSIDIREDQARELTKHLDHGMRKVLFGVVIDDLLRLFKKHGSAKIIGLLVERSISLREVCELRLEE